MADEAVPRPRSLKQRLIPILTKTSHVTAPFLTCFLLIHLSAPVVANVGGSSLSSQVMLLGREYYQTAIGEPYLVLGPLAVHSLSGIIRRALIIYSKNSSEKTSKSPSIFQRIRASLPTTTLSVTAYSVLFLLPIHFSIHRLLPTMSSPPVLALGPSELDYSFVQYGLHHWPVRTWAMYTALVGFAITHAVEGARLLIGSSSLTSTSDPQGAEKPLEVPSKSKVRRKLFAAALALPVLSGLYMLYNEPLYIFPDMAQRLKGVYQLSWLYRTR